MPSFNLIGNITFDPNIKQINNFPPVSPPSLDSYQFFLQKLLPAQPINYGYFIIVPQVTFQNNTFELIGQRLRFYEKGVGVSFYTPTPSNLPTPNNITIGLYPVRLYPNTPISPAPITFRLGLLTEP
jgi:hypothetical protein